jgi:hypothetical protein
MPIATQVEKLDKVYLCKECRSVYLFTGDLVDHRRMSGHSDYVILPLVEDQQLE